MAIYTTHDGLRLAARRSRELVEMLRAESWVGRGGNVEAWMQEVAIRAHETTGKRVRANNEGNFVRDLIKIGLLKKEI